MRRAVRPSVAVEPQQRRLASPRAADPVSGDGRLSQSPRPHVYSEPERRARCQPVLRGAWGLYPNLTMDLLVPQIARLISVENATRLFLLLGSIPSGRVTNR